MKRIFTPAFTRLFIAAALLLAACQPTARTKSNTGASNSAPTSSGLAQATGTPLAGSPNATQIVPLTGDATQKMGANGEAQISIHDQDVSTGSLTADRVVSNGPGWLVIHRQEANGTPGDLIGYAAVKDGVNNQVKVTISPGKATPVLIAILHKDSGVVGVYEYPGPDQPVTNNSGQVVLAVFNAVLANGAAAGGAATSPANGTPASSNSASQPVASQTPTMGNMQNMGSMAGATSTTIASAVKAPTQTGIPEVQISDQPVKNDAIQVSKVVSKGPGWIVIYTVKDGQPDTAIGRAPVHEGNNQNISVEVDTGKAVGTLEGILHLDAGKIGTFEYPGPDVPVVVGLRIASAQFKISNPQAVSPTTEGQANSAPPTNTARPLPYVTVVDQPIHQGMIIIPEIYSDGVSWIVIHPSYPDGTMGSFIGYALLHDGLNENVRVPVDIGRTSPTLMAMLHVDVSKANVPQYPGLDTPLMVNGQMVAPKFNVIGPVSGDVLLTVSTGADGSPHLADSFGMTLYADLNGQPQTCNANAGCPFRPLLSSGQIHADNGVEADKIGVTPLGDGTKQITYGGVPLYYNVNDQKPGDMNGQGVDGRWYVMTP